MNHTPRVIVVEDDKDLCESVVEYLNLAGLDATGVGSSLEFYRALTISAFDIAVLDIGLPDQSGYELAEYLRKNTAMGIIIMTARGEAEDRLLGYSSGADLYLVKPVDSRELAAAIRNLFVRIESSSIKPEPVASTKDWFLEKSTWRLITPDKGTILLTGKEMQFISYLATAAGNTVSRETLLEKLGYGNDEYASRAMDSLVRRLRRKIGDNYPTASPLKTVHTIGYCFTAPLMII